MCCSQSGGTAEEPRIGVFASKTSSVRESPAWADSVALGANFEGNTHTFEDRVAVRKLLPVYGALLPRCRPTCVTSFPCTGGTPYNGASPPPVRSHEPFTIIRTFSRAGTILVEQIGPRDFETALPDGTKISPNPKYSAYAGTAASGPKIKITMATSPKPGRESGARRWTMDCAPTR